jgi:ribonuclease HII
VILPTHPPAALIDGLDDSKVLTAQRRAALMLRLSEHAHIGIGVGVGIGVGIGVGHADVGEIDALNILQATMLAMARAVAALDAVPDHVLVDGNRLPALSVPATAVVGGDRLCLSVAAASIVAKVTRDRLMADLARHFPGYGWERNAGYGTPEHQAALRRLGVTPHHRRSFAPVHKILYPS